MQTKWLALLVVPCVGAALVGTVMLVGPGHVTLARCERDIEIAFIVRDAVSKAPIAGATIEVRDKNAPREAKREVKMIHLVADHEGKATWVRKDSMVEDMISMVDPIV